MVQANSGRRESPVLELLSFIEIDGFVLAQLENLQGGTEILIDILEGRIGASAYQRQNAVYALGKLGETKAIPALVSALTAQEQSLRLSALVALAAIGPDEQARKALRGIAESKEAHPAEVAYAREALGEKPLAPFGEPPHDQSSAQLSKS